MPIACKMSNAMAWYIYDRLSLVITITIQSFAVATQHSTAATQQIACATH